MSSSNSSTADSNAESDGDEPVETLVAGRAKRANAGNRLGVLLRSAEEDEQIDDFWKEHEDEEDFEEASDDDADDALASSDDNDEDDNDDDQGPQKAGSERDLTGEKELRRQERADKTKKRRVQSDVLNLQHLRKKVKSAHETDGTPTASTPRPSKKRKRESEGAEAVPTRSSSRKQTVQSKAVTKLHEEESRLRSRRAKEQQARAAELKAIHAAPALTQEDRLKEAEKVEKRNSKSLNTWEQSENRRAEAQREKLEAMRNKQLDGPVIRWYSGSVIWEGDKIVQNRVWRPKVEELPTSPQNGDAGGQESTPKPTDGKDGALAQTAESAALPETRSANTYTIVTEPKTVHAEASQPASKDELAVSPAINAAGTPPHGPAASSQTAASFLDGIHYYASLPGEQQRSERRAQADGRLTNEQQPLADAELLVKTPPETAPAPTLHPPEPVPAPSPPPLPALEKSPSQAAQTQSLSTQPPATHPPTSTHLTYSTQPLLPVQPPPHLSYQQSPTWPYSFQPVPPSPPVLPSPPAPPPSPPLLQQQAARTLLILSSFPSLATPTPRLQSQREAQLLSTLLPDTALAAAALPRGYANKTFYASAAVPAKPTCAVTGRRARYRHPASALGYRDVAGFRRIQRLVVGRGGRWSALVGAYVGVGRVARGVPEGFGGSGGVGEVEREREREVKREEGEGEARREEVLRVGEMV
ncbi:hypothetical protein LTR50_006871 [Elasticomyces elasticus]|nr:hypothetical protein LTR50_006871 [Elasticomyces elasticus]